MTTLTEQELIDLFEAGRTQGSDEATAHDWGSLPDRSAKRAFIEALQQIIYDRRRGMGIELDAWPDEAEVRDIFELKHT